MKPFSRSSMEFLQAKSQYFQVRLHKQCIKIKQEETAKYHVPCCQMPTVTDDAPGTWGNYTIPTASHSFKETTALNALIKV